MSRQCSIRAFTFAEALASLMLVAIVLPVTIHAVLVANRAFEAARRSEIAAGLGDWQLHQLVLTGDWQNSEFTGRFEQQAGYYWQLTTVDWPEDHGLSTSMTQITLTVFHSLQGRELATSVTTLVGGDEL